MNPSNQRLRDLFDGDPEYYEYHQDYREDIWTYIAARPELTLAVLLLSAVFVYQTLFLFDWDLLPLSELLWNCLVYLTPWRLLDVVEEHQSSLRTGLSSPRQILRTHAAKSEAMRRILGLDVPGGIISNVTQAGRRRLSILPGIGMGSQNTRGSPPGLGNWDNSCYQNSVLQGLAALDSWAEYLNEPTAMEETEDASSKPELSTTTALRGLIASLKDADNNGRRIWTPATLKSMSSWQQQDAQEYFSKILNEVDKEVATVVSRSQRIEGFEVDGASSERPTSNHRSPLSAFRNPLEGLLAQRVGCTSCGYSEGLSMTPFNCLTVPLGHDLEYDISECLNEYTKLERIDGVECGKCTLQKIQRLLSTLMERTKDNPVGSTTYDQIVSRLQAVTTALEEDDYEEKTLREKCNISRKSCVSSTKTRQAVIARPPKSLVLHINRSLFDEMTGELRKNYTLVRFPKILNLGRWCLGSAGAATDPAVEEWKLNPNQPLIAGSDRPSTQRGPVYELRAVVTHYGRHENGHYICYKKHPVTDGKDADEVTKDQWWRLSDDDVMRVTEENVLAQGGVFMLFFDMIAPATPNLSAISPLAQITAPLPTSLPDAVEAASVPLPKDEDFDLLDANEVENTELSRSACEEHTATSVSDVDDESSDEPEQLHYSPAKAILLPPFKQQAGGHSDIEGSGKKLSTPSGRYASVCVSAL